jgi:hypothetical protein
MRLYKFYSSKWAREAIKKRRLKLTTVDDINDPFEFMAAMSKDKKFARIFANGRVIFQPNAVSFRSVAHGKILSYGATMQNPIGDMSLL